MSDDQTRAALARFLDEAIASMMALRLAVDAARPAGELSRLVASGPPAEAGGGKGEGGELPDPYTDEDSPILVFPCEYCDQPPNRYKVTRPDRSKAFRVACSRCDLSTHWALSPAEAAEAWRHGQRLPRVRR